MPNVVYTTAERVEMIKLREQGMSYGCISKHFSEAHPDRPKPSKTTVRSVMKFFRQTGNLDVRRIKCSRPTRQLNENTKLNICLKAQEDPKKPVSKIAEELHLSKTTVRKILVTAKIITRKSRKPEGSSSDDEDENRTTFSTTMMEGLKADEKTLRRVCFTNESTILFLKQPDNQNIHICSWEIQHLIDESKQYYEKLHVWTGAVDNELIGPFFIQGVLNAETYLKMLREDVVPALKAIKKNGPVIWYQHAGAPPYHTANVFAYLHQEFPDEWVGINVPVHQSTRKLDVSLLDSALWGKMKNVLNTGKTIQDLTHLQNKVIEIFENMESDAACDTIRAYYEQNLGIQDDGST